MNYQWIKIRHKLLRSPKLFIAMRELGLTKAEVIGFFVMALAVFDEHGEDGLIKNTTPDILDGMIEQPGITEVLARPDIGWIEITDEGIRILDWDKHNSVEAKKKAVLAKRNKIARNQKKEIQPEPDPENRGTRSTIRQVAEGIQSNKDDARKVLRWVNEIKGGNPFSESEVHLDFIASRLKEKGVTMEGIRKMLEYKWRDFAGTEMQKYFRPSTLFNKTKFATYYDEKDFDQSENNSPPEPEEYRCQPDGTGVEKHPDYITKKIVNGKLREELIGNPALLYTFDLFIKKFHIDESLYTARIKREREQNAIQQ